MTMEKLRSVNKTDHTIDLKEAIYYLPPEFDIDTLFRALKEVYGDEKGLEHAKMWFQKGKVTLPPKFEDLWKEADLTTYQKHIFENYLSENVYEVAKDVGWIAKAFRKGSNTKKPPSKTKMKKVGMDLNAGQKLEEELIDCKERHLTAEQKSFIPECIKNIDGACYFHRRMVKSQIPENEDDYLSMLNKVVDCEVIVEAAYENIIEQYGQDEDDKTVEYLLRLTNKRGNSVLTKATHEELSSIGKFTSFLLSKGFVNFKGDTKKFDIFREFLINEQDYPTIKKVTSWGEYKPGQFLFENGLYDVNKGFFYEANGQNRIKIGEQFLICPTGNGSINPPRLSLPKEDSSSFLAKKFTLWESFNGRLNVRATIGFALASIYSRRIVEKDSNFPILFKFGERGTGKSSSMDWFMALFGYQKGTRQAISSQNTFKGITRSMSIPVSFPYFLDDFRDHVTNKNAPNLDQTILSWYNRGAFVRAQTTNDNRTHSTKMDAVVAMTGNDKPSDHATVSRMIMLTYNRYLKGVELMKVPYVSDHTKRFSEFVGLILKDYDKLYNLFMEYMSDYKELLIKKLPSIDATGRYVFNWSYVLAGIRCVPHIIPELRHWLDDFEELTNEICLSIEKEMAQQKEANPLHEFFEVIEHYATQLKHPGSDYTNKHFRIDHRHFRYREVGSTENDKGETFNEPVLFINLNGIWNVLLESKADFIRQTTKKALEAKLQSSGYYINKSIQIPLTKDMGDQSVSNRRCYGLNVQQLKANNMLVEFIEKAIEYDREIRWK